MSNRPKHTAGPWTATENGSDTIDVVDPQGFAVAVVGGSTREERAANAKAIAAVPKMLHALRSVALRHEDDGPCYCTIRIEPGHAHHLSCLEARGALKAANL